MLNLLAAKPKLTVFIGFIMMLLGVIFPFLMVVKMIESTFFLNFFSYTLSLLGMIFGIIGIAMGFKGK
jgi:vacuolar-type H+-ATPase subunit I/STV1